MKLRSFHPILALVAATGAGMADDFARDVRPLVERYCTDCHNDRKSKGGVNLAKFTNSASLYRDPKLWETALRQVDERQMPPDGKNTRQPSQEERLQFTEKLGHLLDNPGAGMIRLDPGRTVARRLSATEYNNTVRDLLGVSIRPADAFPADGGGGGGFDNNADTLFVPPILMEKYLEATEDLLVAADPARIFRVLPAWHRSEMSAARSNLKTFARRAWRRPPAREDLDRLVGIYQRARAAGAAYDVAVKSACKAVLVSPRFLFRTERDPAGKDPLPVEAHSLASRLSYFLWSSMPDDRLSSLADSGKLLQPVVLEAEVRRMLADPKSRTLAEQFVGQWLGIRALGTVAAPDPGVFPEFTPALRNAMVAEPVEFFAGLLAADGSLLELLDSRYVWVNADLAKHYGLPGVTGTNFVRVDLADSNRGGITGMAAVLTQTSYPRRTSPVLRGKWLLEEVLGTPPPPPPPLVATLSPDDAKRDGLTFRQRLEQHRKDPNCAACHNRMDPLGFALENFDPVGRWRTKIGEEAVDTSGKLVTGEEVNGPVALKKALLTRKHLFIRHVTEKMLAYALGRGLEYYDIPAVKQITANLSGDDFRASRLVMEVVRSAPFRLRRGAAFEEGAVAAKE
jgi:hypothetical protein